MKKNTVTTDREAAESLKADRLAAEEAIEAWTDPREKNDRRQISDPDKIPATGCRREKDRRVTRYIREDQWWLHRDYNKSKE